jgi:hypothetical protein
LDIAPRTFGFAEHVVGVWGGEQDPEAEMCAHLAGDCSFKDRVRVKLYDWRERARLGVMTCMHVLDVHEDGFQLRTRIVFGLEEPHPHVMGVVVNDEQAIAEAMCGGDVDWSPQVKEHVEEGTGRFRAGSGVSRCSCGFV